MKKIGKIGFAAGIFLGASDIFFTLAIEYTVAANVLVILASNPLFSALFSWILIGDVIKLRTAVTMFVCMGAIALIFYDEIGGDGSANGMLGNVFAMCAAVTLGLFFAIVHFADKRKDTGVNMVPCNVVSGFFIATGE